MRTKGIFLALVAGMILMFTGCSKDDEPKPEVKLPSVGKDSILVSVPESLKGTTDSNLKMAASIFSSINQMSNISRMMLPPEDAASYHSDVPGAVAYTWSAGEVTYWFTYYTSNDTCYWKVDADFGEGRVPYIEGQESCDGKAGSISLLGGDLPPYHASWSYNSEGDLSFRITGNVQTHYEITGTLNADGSGYAKIVASGMKIFEIWWNADGSGRYKYYLYPPSEGSWSANG